MFLKSSCFEIGGPYGVLAGNSAVHSAEFRPDVSSATGICRGKVLMLTNHWTPAPASVDSVDGQSCQSEKSDSMLLAPPLSSGEISTESCRLLPPRVESVGNGGPLDRLGRCQRVS